jgi:tetratricopeptide (TPR) repeat protein
MKKNIVQQIFEVIIPILLGLLVLGTFFDSISNAFSLVDSPKKALGLSLFIFLIWIIIEIYFLFRKLKWITKSGTPIHITKISKKLRLQFLGGIILIWIPVFLAIDKESKDNNIIEKINTFGVSSFSKSNSFKLLILPIDDYDSTKNSGFSKALIKSFEEFNFNTDKKIEIKYSLNSKLLPQIITSKIAKEIGKEKGADLVLFGSYENSNLSPQKDFIIRFVVVNDVLVIPLPYQGQVINVMEVEEGKLAKDIDFIIKSVWGMREFDQGNFSEAISIFKKIVKDKNAEYLQVLIAQAYFERKDFKNAKYHYSQEIKRGSNLMPAYNNLAYIYYLEKNYKEAIKIANLGLKNIPDSSSMLLSNTLGVVYDSDNQTKKAEETFAKNYQKHQNSTLTAFQMGQMEAKKKNYVNAIFYFEKSVKLQPTFIHARYQYANTLGLLDEDEKAFEVLNGSLQIKPNDAETHIGLSMLYAMNGIIDRAVFHYNIAINLDNSLKNLDFENKIIHTR